MSSNSIGNILFLFTRPTDCRKTPCEKSAIQGINRQCPEHQRNVTLWGSVPVMESVIIILLLYWLSCDSPCSDTCKTGKRRWWTHKTGSSIPGNINSWKTKKHPLNLSDWQLSITSTCPNYVTNRCATYRKFHVKCEIKLWDKARTRIHQRKPGKEFCSDSGQLELYCIVFIPFVLKKWRIHSRNFFRLVVLGIFSDITKVRLASMLSHFQHKPKGLGSGHYLWQPGGWWNQGVESITSIHDRLQISTQRLVLDILAIFRFLFLPHVLC